MNNPYIAKTKCVRIFSYNRDEFPETEGEYEDFKFYKGNLRHMHNLQNLLNIFIREWIESSIRKKEKTGDGVDRSKYVDLVRMATNKDLFNASLKMYEFTCVVNMPT
jgi:hypothetical protein